LATSALKWPQTCQNSCEKRRSLADLGPPEQGPEGAISLADDRSTGELGERPPAVVLLRKRREQSSLKVTCDLSPGDRAPGDDQLVGVIERATHDSRVELTASRPIHRRLGVVVATIGRCLRGPPNERERAEGPGVSTQLPGENTPVAHRVCRLHRSRRVSEQYRPARSASASRRSVSVPPGPCSRRRPGGRAAFAVRRPPRPSSGAQRTRPYAVCELRRPRR
jgi:hypothetical protein